MAYENCKNSVPTPSQTTINSKMENLASETAILRGILREIQNKIDPTPDNEPQCTGNAAQIMPLMA